MASSGAANSGSISPPKRIYNGIRPSLISPMTSSSSPMGTDIDDVPGHNTDPSASLRSKLDAEDGTCTAAPRPRGRLPEFAAAAPPRVAFSGFAPPYVGGGSVDCDVDDEDDENWEEDDEEGVPAEYLGGWDSAFGQGQEESEREDEDEISDGEEDVESEGGALPRAPFAERGKK